MISIVLRSIAIGMIRSGTIRMAGIHHIASIASLVGMVTTLCIVLGTLLGIILGTPHGTTIIGDLTIRIMDGAFHTNIIPIEADRILHAI